MNAYETQFRSCDTECLFLPFFLRCSQVLVLELHTENSASLYTVKPLCSDMHLNKKEVASVHYFHSLVCFKVCARNGLWNVLLCFLVKAPGGDISS